MPKASPTRKRRLQAAFALCLPLSLAFIGCDQEPDVETYTAKRDAPLPATLLQPVNAQANSAPSSASSGSKHPSRTQLTWAVPSGWKQENSTGMRVATLKPQAGTESVAIAVTYLPGDKSDLVSNINRWRGQIDLAPVGPDEITAEQHSFSNRSGLGGHYIDLQGRDDRMIVAWFKFPDGSWYFKMTGDDDDVSNNVTTMRQFAGSITRTGAGLPPKDTTPPAGQAKAINRTKLSADSIQAPAEAQDFSANGIAGKAAKAWTLAENTPMLLMNFETATNCRVTVSSFPGNVGGREANVGRWVRQLGLSADKASVNERNFLLEGNPDSIPVDAFEIVPIELADDSKASIIATIRDAEKTFFIKIVGDAKPVATELENFLYFISQLKLPLTKPLPPEGWQ